jgi:xylulokinase
MPIYVGLDCSTQSLSAAAIEIEGSRREVLIEHAVDLDVQFPHFGTRHGVLPSADPHVARTPPLVWVEALDHLMWWLAQDSGLPLGRIAAIAGSAQQHGSVYLNETAAPTLSRLTPEPPIAEQLAGIFSRAESPIWMDSSPAPECEAITAAVGGPEALARLTGSRAAARFTGPQIRRFAVGDPTGYAHTASIHLVSSFLATLLAGRSATVDPGDGAGMNLMDIARGVWSPAALEATAPDLLRRLPEIRPSATVVGPLAPYWRKRYGFPASQVVTFSGDNPSSLVGAGLVRDGQVGISLGTSDTLFAPRPGPEPDPSGAGHVFGSPMGGFMGLICCRNGSLARERVRDAFGLDWTGFSRALRETPPGNGGAVMLPWFEPEVTPPVSRPGVRRYGLDPADGPANVRAVVEGQMLALARHSRWLGARPAAIHAMGGAAANREVLQVMADVHGAAVYPLRVGNAACLGAALRALHAERLAAGRPLSWPEVIRGFAEPDTASRVSPVPANVARYAELAGTYESCEEQALKT